MDFELISRQFLRALRGKRSQLALARRLRFRSNVAHSWETGRNYPTAAQTLRVAQRLGIDVRAALHAFYRNPPEWLSQVDPTSAQSIVRLLSDLRGRTPVVHLARTSGLSRFAIARMLSGRAQPRLPDFLRLVEACSLRTLDLIAAFVEPAQLPALAEPWRKLEAARRAAYDQPWTLAVIRALELQAYRKTKRHKPGWIAKRLSITRDIESTCVVLLEQSGQIHFDGSHYRIIAGAALDTRSDPERAKSLRKWWAERALERFGEGDERIFSYNVFGVSSRDYQRVRELHRAYFQELRAIVAASQPVERVALANFQLIGLDAP
jgi:DNA-binding phage protein